MCKPDIDESHFEYVCDDFNWSVVFSIDEIRSWKNQVKYIFDTDQRTTLVDRRTLLHMSCHAGLEYDFVLKLLSND